MFGAGGKVVARSKEQCIQAVLDQEQPFYERNASPAAFAEIKAFILGNEWVCDKAMAGRFVRSVLLLGSKSVEDLYKLTDADLLRELNFGKKSLALLRTVVPNPEPNRGGKAKGPLEIMHEAQTM